MLDNSAKFQQQIPVAINLLKQKSREQISQLFNLLASDQKVNDEDQDGEQIPKSYGNPSKDARATILVLIDLINYCKNFIENSETKRLAEGETMEVDELKRGQSTLASFRDNLLYSLLYLDGLIMINIDLIRKISELSPLVGKSLADILFELLNSKFIDDNAKEIASHILSADLSFANPDAVQMNIWKDLMYWTLNFYNTK